MLRRWDHDKNVGVSGATRDYKWTPAVGFRLLAVIVVVGGVGLAIWW